jgi:molybdopterin converting factor small subunit
MKIVQLRYFGALADALQCREETLDWLALSTAVTDPSLAEGAPAPTLARLLALLAERHHNWPKDLSQLQLAVNHELLPPHRWAQFSIVPGTEIALFPPVTGG